MDNIRYDLNSEVFFANFGEQDRQLQHLLKMLTGKTAHNILQRLNNLTEQKGAALLLAYSHKPEDERDKFRDETLVGMGTLIVTHQMAGIKARIEDVVVDEAYRGKGIGEEIVRRLIRRARKEHAESVELTSAAHRTAANALYRKLGFEQRETNVYRMELRKQKRTTTRRK